MEETEKEEVIKRCTEMLEEMMGDITVPRNIRKSLGMMKNRLLNGGESLAIRAAAVISELEELNTNPNIPSHARTALWSVVSNLETVSVEE